MLVEDDLVNQKVALTLLERWGHRVAVAPNGLVALDMLAQNQYDVVLMDMMMPELDGLETVRRIRKSEGDSHIPVIAMTANAQESDRERCLAAGMDDYISKPIKALVFAADAAGGGGSRLAPLVNAFQHHDRAGLPGRYATRV